MGIKSDAPSIDLAHETEAAAKRTIWDCVESKAMVALRKNLIDLEQVEDKSKLYGCDTTKLRNMKKDNAALVKAYHDYLKMTLIYCSMNDYV